MTDKLNVEIRIKGHVILDRETETNVEDTNPPVEAVFTAFDPTADGMAITETGDVNAVFGNNMAVSWSTYDGKLVPASPLTDLWTILGDLQITGTNIGFQSTYGSLNKFYLGIGDYQTDFIGLKLEWELAAVFTPPAKLRIYMVSVTGGTENATLLKEVTTDTDTFPAITGWFKLWRSETNTYNAELSVDGGGIDSRTKAFTDPDITVHSENSAYNGLDGLLEWYNLSRS